MAVLRGSTGNQYEAAEERDIFERFGALPREEQLLAGLTGAVLFLAFVAALAGLFGAGGSGRYSFITVQGEHISVYGHGLYEHDSVFKAAGNRGTDVITLALALPLLAISALLALRGSFRARLLWLGTMVYFLYVYASLSLGTAHNALFLPYVAAFAASTATVALLFDSGAVRERLSAALPPSAPRRFPGWFMIASGFVTLVVWLMPADLEGGTTLVTNALDMAVIVPAAIAGGVLMLRGHATGYRIAFALLVLEVLLLPMIVVQTVFQVRAGIDFTAGEVIGPIAGFGILAALASWVLVALLRSVRTC